MNVPKRGRGKGDTAAYQIQMQLMGELGAGRRGERRLIENCDPCNNNVREGTC